MPLWIYMIAAVGVGALVICQPLINAILASATGTPFGATAISLCVAFIGGLVLLAVNGMGDMNRATLASVPWWVYLAGFIGTIFVASGVIIAPVTGALIFFVCVVGGQLVGATFADHVGAFGLEVRPVSWSRLAGLVLVLAGAVLVQRG